jgi:ankyrin repeat protein
MSTRNLSKSKSAGGAAMLAFALASAVFAAESRLTLIDTVKIQDIAKVRALLAQHTNVNATDADGSTALHWAAQRDNAEIARLLIAAGANVKAATRYNITPLWLACGNGDTAIVTALLDAGADANEVAEEGETALMKAARTGKGEPIKVLLSHGAKVNTTEPFHGQTALMWAAAGGNDAAAEMLVEFGAEVKAKSKAGLTPLLFAVRNGHIDAARVLLQHGANANDVATDGTSALNMAVVNAYFELASVLLDHGADPNMADPRGSALHTIAWLRRPGADGAAGVGNTPHGPPVQTGDVTAIQLAEKLLQHGANANSRIDWKENTFGKEGGTARNPPNIQLGRHFLSYVGATPFYVAAHNGDIEYMRLLKKYGADGTTPTRADITPLMAAAGLDYWEGEAPGPFTGVPETERLEAVKFALEVGNDINAHANFGDYPMTGDTGYTLFYYPLNIDELVNKGVGDPRWSGSTALIGGIISGQASIVQFLIDHGARADDHTKLGWTPLMVAEGVFFANAKKEYPQAAAIITKALEAKGIDAASQHADLSSLPKTLTR